MDFELSENQRKIKENARELSQEFREKEKEWAKEGKSIAQEEKKFLADLGYTGISLPEEFGGRGLGNLEGMFVLEEFEKNNCPSLAHVVHEASFGPIRQIDFWGTEKQKEKYISAVCKEGKLMSIAMTEPKAGSALTDLKTKAEKEGDEYVITGQKRFVSGAGESEFYYVFVKLEDVRGAPGIGTIVVEKDVSGLSFGDLDIMMGHRTIPHRDVFFDNVRLPAENLVLDAGEFKKAMKAFNVERLGNATRSLGNAAGALEESMFYVQKKMSEGKVKNLQAIKSKLAEMKMLTDSARLMLYQAASNSGRGLARRLDSSIAKCFANEIAKRVTDLSLEVCRKNGFLSSPIERKLVDSRGWPVAAGTVQMQRIGIISALLRRKFNQRR